MSCNRVAKCEFCDELFTLPPYSLEQSVCPKCREEAKRNDEEFNQESQQEKESWESKAIGEEPVGLIPVSKW